jgi:hypothetical protein
MGQEQVKWIILLDVASRVKRLRPPERGGEGGNLGRGCGGQFRGGHNPQKINGYRTMAGPNNDPL